MKDEEKVRKPVQTREEFVNLSEIEEQFEEKGFFRRLADMIKGFRKPPSSRAYKEARITFQRLAAPLVAVVSVALLVMVLLVVTTVQSARKKVYDVRIAQIEETPDDLLKPEEEDTPEEPDVDMTADVNVDITVPVADIPVPSADLAAPPPAQPLVPAAVSAAPSPVVMSAINAGVKMTALDDSGSGWGKLIARQSAKKKPNLDGCLIGTIIDFKKDGKGRDRPDWLKSYNADARSLIENNFSQGSLMKFHVPPKNVALTHLWIPPQSAANGPKAFGVENAVKPSGFVVYYSGSLASYKKGKWRFWSYFDDFIFIRVDGRILFDSNGCDGKSSPRTDWKSSAPDKIGKAWCPQQGWGKMAPSDWFELQPNKPVKIEFMIGEHPGGAVGGLVLIEEYGKTYPKNADGTIAYPIFTMRPLPSSTRFNLEDDPVFRNSHHLMNVDSPRFNAGPKKEEKPAGVSADDITVDVSI
ncbi:MAG TPA: hypothetical protein DER26_07465 [Verrucomicrobia bacterium]|nr:hypothetical protein [Verrucomicrobiota bacterium]